MERVEGDARAAQMDVQAARDRLDAALVAEPSTAMSHEQAELRRALGVL